MRKLLVTSALPYANGHIHIGHLVEHIQTDIWVRFQKLRGNTCHYMCADDAHGTPIMLSAKKQGITPKELIDTFHKEHLADFRAFHIEHDHYYTTDSEENRVLSEFIYGEAKKKDAIDEKEIEQYFCDTDGIFLPDRFIKGTCPNCQAPDQYGDACEKCSTTYNPTQLINPRCAECGRPPVLKKSTHYFFKLSAYSDQIKKWLDDGDHVQSEVRNKLKEWFDQGIKDWDISRDAPYFGFKIPGTVDKYFYVWLDAPVGYIATTQNWGKVDYQKIWKGNEYEIHHFIGKDILYFHALFWPAMLMVSGFSLPKKVHVHGFLTVNGEKMSKSRGTFINAKDYIKHLSPEFLRYYYASKLSNSVDDIDLNFEDFVFKVNSDVVGKVVNIASRLGSIVTKKLGGKLTTVDSAINFNFNTEQFAQDVEELAYAKAMRDLMVVADNVNKYINDNAPWAAEPEKAAVMCTTALNALKDLSILLSPILPKICSGIQAFLNLEPQSWKDLGVALENHAINPYQHLAQRVDPAQIQALISAETLS